MNEFVVTVQEFHESFKGFDSSDGNREIIVSARNQESAKKKTRNKLNGEYKRSIQSRWFKFVDVKKKI